MPLVQLTSRHESRENGQTYTSKIIYTLSVTVFYVRGTCLPFLTCDSWWLVSFSLVSYCVDQCFHLKMKGDCFRNVWLLPASSDNGKCRYILVMFLIALHVYDAILMQNTTMVSLDGVVCRQSRWHHSVPHSRWQICITMATLWQQQDGCYMLLWKRYGNNKMAAMRYYVLHLQQYSHRLNLLYFFFFQGSGSNAEQCDWGRSGHDKGGWGGVALQLFRGEEGSSQFPGGWMCLYCAK